MLMWHGTCHSFFFLSIHVDDPLADVEEQTHMRLTCVCSTTPPIFLFIFFGVHSVPLWKKERKSRKPHACKNSMPSICFLEGKRKSWFLYNCQEHSLELAFHCTRLLPHLWPVIGKKYSSDNPRSFFKKRSSNRWVIIGSRGWHLKQVCGVKG